MDLHFQSVWDRVGHAPTSGGADGLLERSGYKPMHFRSLEDGSSLFNVVYLEGTQ